MIRLLHKTEYCRNKEVIKRWKSQYSQYTGDFTMHDGRTPKQVVKELAKLGPNACKLEIDLAIGNSAWTELLCTLCSSDVDSLILFGDDIDVPIMRVCFECVRTANTLFRKSC